ncbi:hypothetical protein SASPL_149965 [Salvia splendens]|uniref:Disease resistance protein winged helix domain-containing protein n=1 Tax=Salvia splendens TaxID=180675 RepID=A0A8X8W5C1_SALSN|nr:hypothetical protein SASPL_149965 [Salvia splendens]
MLSRIIELILTKVWESILSKLVEQTVDNAHNSLKIIKDFELNLKALQKKLKPLGAKASDVEEEIKNLELSGRKKRKREVEEWLEEVKSIEKQVVEGDKLPTNGMVGEAFNENLETILTLLESGQVSSIGVCGLDFVGEDNEELRAARLKEIARSVAELCGGQPLGIVTVAGSMRGERAIHTWRNAYAELKEHVSGIDGIRDGDVYNVLKYNEELMRDRLVREFISGGLVDERKTRRMLVEQGHSILDKLVNVCLLESCAFPGRFGPTECVKMHDLVREWGKDLEKVSFMNSGIMRIEEGMSPDCPKLSTLLLFGNHWACFKLENVPYLGEMEELKELDLSETDIREVPQGVEELFNLKFLALDARKLEMLPRGLFLKLEKLQHLELPLHLEVEVEEIENLKLLEELSGRVENVNDFNSFITKIELYSLDGMKGLIEKGEIGASAAPAQPVFCFPH